MHPVPPHPGQPEPGQPPRAPVQQRYPLYAYQTRPDAHMKPRSSRRVLALGILTLGLYGACWHAWTNSDLGRFGRPRGRMPFAYIQVSPAWSCIAYLFGWLAALALWALTLTFLFDGKAEGLADWMGVASSAVLAAPLWSTARVTMQRIRTARMLAGIAAPIMNPGVVGVVAVLFPPWYAWQAQRALDPVWAACGKPASAPHEILRPVDIASEVQAAGGLLLEEGHAVHAPQPEPASVTPTVVAHAEPFLDGTHPHG